MNRLVPWLLAAVLAVAWIGSCQRSDRALGALELQLDSSRAREVRAHVRGDSLARAYHRDTVRVVRTIRDLDTMVVTAETWKHDTLRVTEFVERAAAVAEACTAVRRTCDERIAEKDRELAEVRFQRDSIGGLAARPWTAAGLAYDPHAARYGAFVDRDWSRLRLGLTVTPDDRSVRVGVRIGWRW